MSNTSASSRLQHQAQQPRLATEADVKTEKRTRKRTEGAAADEEKHEDTSSARVEDGPMSLTRFGNIVEPPAPEKCIGGALVNEVTAAPKQYLPPVEVRMLSSASGGLLLARTASTTMRTIFPPPPLPSSLFESTEERSVTTTNC